MIKFLTLTKSAWIGFLIALVASFIMAVTTHAEEPQDTAAKYGVSFPITDLGGCKDYSACRSYCEDPLNASSCIEFAKQKGFYRQESFEVNNKILEAAKGALGCDSKTSCLSFCEISANHDKCDAFSKGQGLVGGRVDDPSKTQVISRAKEVLGCDSATGCQSLCSKEENRQKCSEFAKTVGLHGGQQRVGPGGCASESTCKSFCADPQNFQVCSGFTEVAGGKFKGPGGCDSEVSCRLYCQSNEKECRGNIQTKYDPVDMCSRTPNCAWSGNNCQCGYYGETEETVQKAGEYALFCRANPDKCRSDQRGGLDPSGQRREFEDYCAGNPDKCRTPDGEPGGSGRPGDYRDPAAQCARYGCSWQADSCQCAGIKDYDSAAEGRKAEEYAKFCRENPDKCRSPQSGGGGGAGDDYCRQNPQRCAPSEDPRDYSPRPDSTSYPQQSSYPQVQNNPQASYQPSASYQPQYNSQPQQSYQPSSYTQPNTYTQPYSAPQPQQQSQPAPQPAQESQPAPAPQQESAPQPQPAQESQPAPAPAVQGISVVRNLWERILDLIP